MSDALSIKLFKSGDFVGVRPPSTIVPAALTVAERQELEALLHAARSDRSAPAAGREGSERRQYDIEVVTAETTTTFHATEGGESTALRALIDFIEAHKTP